MPEVSVIVPVYNAEKYLTECVDSVLAQTYRDFEIILVDNGSSDGSPAICRAYASRFPSAVKVITTTNVGLSAARNIGTQAAEGEYIFYLDADDTISSDALAYLHDIIATSGAGVDIVISQYCRKAEELGSGSGRMSVYKPADIIAPTLYQEPLVHSSAWAKLYRKSILGTEPFTAGRYYEDIAAFAPIYMRARNIAVADRALYFYRPNAQSFLNTWSDRRADALWAVDSVRDFVVHKCPEAAAAALSRSFSAYFNIFILSSRHADKELADRCWSFVRTHRRAMLADPRVRLKNKIGALLSYCGSRLCLTVAELFKS